MPFKGAIRLSRPPEGGYPCLRLLMAVQFGTGIPISDSLPYFRFPHYSIL